MSYYFLDRYLRKLRHTPVVMTSLFCSIWIVGMIAIYSASGGVFSSLFIKQLIIFVLFFIIAIIIGCFNFSNFLTLIPIIYFVSILFLLLVSIIGKYSMGATRWLSLGFFDFQPSELIKISLILYLAKYLNDHTKSDKLRFINICFLLLLILLPTLVVLKQPDLGTAVIILAIGFGMLFAVGVEVKYFMILGISVLILLPLIYFNLHDYQKIRIKVFLNPELDALGSGYNIIQSKIAIGSGGIFGQGFLEGSQSRLKFLPACQTDFIFAVIGEEFGFIGSLVVILLYMILCINIMLNAVNYRNKFAKLASIGVGILIFVHVIINISMTAGLLPVVGIPLPLISYGGSVTVLMLLCLGVLINCHINQSSNI